MPMVEHSNDPSQMSGAVGDTTIHDSRACREEFNMAVGGTLKDMEGIFLLEVAVRA